MATTPSKKATDAAYLLTQLKNFDSKILEKKYTDITSFNTKAEWQAAKDAGLLDPNKYYSYPEMDSPAFETTMRVTYTDDTTQDFIIYCKEV